MCGIAGIWNRGEHKSSCLADINAVVNALSHRGPDDSGVWISQESGLALGHRRLSILDLSPHGHQPMHSLDGSWIIVFNGEIYNHRELREFLPATQWRGHSDTETIVELISAIGFHEAISKLRGMFAIAAWNIPSNRLFLARDTIGEKPLYYGYANSTFCFASELRALAQFSCISTDVSPSAVYDLFRYGYVRQQKSILSGVSKLAPGMILEVTMNSHSTSAYWDLQKPLSSVFPGTYSDAINLLYDKLRLSVCRQMLSDVPLGAFLSGGVDSSVITAIAQELSSNPIKTFTIGFDQEEFNEAPFARDIASYLGTDHTELILSENDALDIVEKIPKIWDEPFADASQIPMYFVARLAKRSVSVCLSGDGGDELFFGYKRYQRAMTLEKYASSGFARKMASLASMVPITHRHTEQVSAWSQAHSPIARYRTHMIFAHRPLFLMKPFLIPDAEIYVGYSSLPAYTAYRLNDVLNYLPDDILCKVDRAAMALSLETRIPLLDQDIVEFAFTLPGEFLYDERNGKRILRDLMHRFIPPALTDRPKKGFSVPLARWLRGSLRIWASDMVSSISLSDPILDAKAVARYWDKYLAGSTNNSRLIWAILQYVAWKRSFPT